LLIVFINNNVYPSIQWLTRGMNMSERAGEKSILNPFTTKRDRARIVYSMSMHDTHAHTLPFFRSAPSRLLLIGVARSPPVDGKNQKRDEATHTLKKSWKVGKKDDGGRRTPTTNGTNRDSSTTRRRRVRENAQRE
jgi:hypothetical protein